MLKRVIFAILFILILSEFAIFRASHAEECTVFIAGKNTTADGSIIFAKTEDDGRKEVDYLWYVPRMTHPAGAVVTLRAGGTIPQVTETYSYLWDQCPGTAYSHGLINEWGLALGSNGCASKEDDVEEVEARGDLVHGGIGFMLRFILAERCKTAREAVELAAQLLDEYGYNASGRNLNIVGPHEAWQLQMVRGKQYVARRVQDDEVAIVANTFTIRKVDMDDEENFICSPHLIDYAIERGWYDPEIDGNFDFALAYAPEKIHTHPGNTNRQWMLAHLLDQNFSISHTEASTGILPVSVKPARKLSLEDIMKILRSHYEGTPLDTSGYTETGVYAKSPHKNPRPICHYTTHRTTVIQQRSWMPPAIGTVIWRALDQPCSSVFTPWYLGATEIPELMQKAPLHFDLMKKNIIELNFNLPESVYDLDLSSASCMFTLLGQIVDAEYEETIDFVRNTWSNFEQGEFSKQASIEKSALELYESDKSKIRAFLSLYSSSQVQDAFQIAQKLINDIKRQLWGTPVKKKMQIHK